MSAQILIKLPKEMKQELRIIAVKKETTMTEILIDLIQDYISKNR